MTLVFKKQQLKAYWTHVVLVQWKLCNSRMLIALASLVFIAIFLLSLRQILKNDLRCSADQNNQTDRNKNVDPNREKTRELPGCSITNITRILCSIECFDTKLLELQVELDEKLKNEDDCNNDLNFTITHLLDSSLKKNWLKSWSTTTTHLSLVDTKISKLDQKVFSHTDFPRLQFLEITSSKITTLKKESFLEMSAVKTFVFKQFRTKLKFEVEEKSLEGMQGSLQILEVHMHKFEPQSIRNLVGEGASLLSKLVTLDLSYNTIIRLPKRSFWGTRNVVQVYLRENQIEYIELEAFEGLTKLGQIYLNDNLLKTLPENLFLDIDAWMLNQTIYLHNNPWVCNCSLLWLSNYMKIGKINQKSPPECNSNPLLVEESSCTTNNSSVPNDIINVTCEKYENFGSLSDYTLYLENNDLKLDFEEKDDLLVVVSSAQVLEDNHLFWFNSKNHSEKWCLKEIKNSTSIQVSHPETTYLFCLIPTNETMNQLKVSPFSCFPWTSKPEWSSRTWIYNKQIAYYVPSVLAILLLFIFLTSVVTYVCIRKFPTLIEGNARVVIVKKVREQPRVIESSVKENEGEVYFDTESLSQGYLTPRHHRYMQVKNRSTLHRSLSDGSCSRSTSSLSCTEADVRKVGTHRSERGRDLGRKVLEYKPPLPPPNNQQTVKNT